MVKRAVVERGGRWREETMGESGRDQTRYAVEAS